eukprot:GEZU01014743.1.p1 GENE.GEZU01014743.1~~GEZU01014743.1.p1  ORF type:complete len:314 (+),score=77.21 GEZU01014743.1:164-1105(+)
MKTPTTAIMRSLLVLLVVILVSCAALAVGAFASSLNNRPEYAAATATATTSTSTEQPIGKDNSALTARALERQQKEAYVTIMYGGTPKDYEYFLGIRVMWQSLRESGTTRKMITLVTPDVDPEMRRIFEEDGSEVREVGYVENPYEGQDKYNNRFKYVLVKLLAWNMTEFDRVILLDADLIILENLDELFLCGSFCAVYINPCIFHTGLMVLQPDAAVFQDMMNKLSRNFESYDGGDQGFLNTYYPKMLEAPLFVPPPAAKDYAAYERHTGLMRLPFGYHLDSIYYYQRFRWEVPCSEKKAVGFPGITFMKPW